MRVLVISQVVFSKTNNTGKTLLSYFRGFDRETIAQLYFHSEIPTDDTVCTRYYRFNDWDALKSVFNKKITGKVYHKEEIKHEVPQSRTDYGIKRKIYVAGSKHTPSILLLRDMIWKYSNWNNANLKEWITSFNPDVIFFLSGDGTFSYKICQSISSEYNIPFVPICVDDYYLNNRNKGKFLANYQHKSFMRVVKKCYSKAYSILTICDKMKYEYSSLFEKTCHTLHTSAIRKTLAFSDNSKKISYIGNVGYNRYKQLIDMGNALCEIGDENLPNQIDVYSGSLDSRYIDPLKKARGICFHGEITSEEVLSIMADSMAVIHTESFDSEYRELTRYSISTKIAETLMYGPCLIAYGPEDIASIQYLLENNAAYVITNPNELKEGLLEVLSNKELRDTLINNARRLASRNHDELVNPQKLKNWLKAAIERGPLEL